MNNPQTVACPVCKGWGQEPLPITGSSQLCRNCGGESLQVQTDELVIFWDLPHFFDYRGRNLTRVARILAGTGSVLLLLLIACVFFYLISSTASVL
ncbi:MAG: hypothetical protein TR69_WS6001001134 [candidate division WS6 bacterium OLB20]|uniref:Uncharacterized protein n=1 Tax=candidate division WS6 bacterium OLB20 TaxID=1617426 RepID=A0A136LWU8_9BACT|nr:MAG: hypothetical protein TR69_WS6001001134 [candidate division WS6 bacterium OLB20]